jgi:hypothetical protein
MKEDGKKEGIKDTEGMPMMNGLGRIIPRRMTRKRTEKTATRFLTTSKK